MRQLSRSTSSASSELSDDVAIVHAAMTLSGQTAIAAIRQPGARKTIFSFVVHRVAGGGCARPLTTPTRYRTWKRMLSAKTERFGGKLPHRPGVLMSVAEAFGATSIRAPHQTAARTRLLPLGCRRPSRDIGDQRLSSCEVNQ